MCATGIFVIESTKLQLVVTDVIDILNVSVIDKQPRPGYFAINS